MRKTCAASAAILALMALAGGANADLSIYEIQSNTSDGDASSYHGQTHNVTGGIVTHISWMLSKPRVYLQDPTRSDWGGIVVKDWEGGELAGSVQVGDWLSFESIYIEENRGTTHLQYNKDWAPAVTFAVDTDPGYAVPDPVLLTAADLAVPVDHTASEPYESMLAMLEDVTVGTLGWGKEPDNYQLLQGGYTAWGTDYSNVDAGGSYHPYIHEGAELESITGIVEQYTRWTEPEPPEEPELIWDYYQLCTRSTSDIVPEPTTLSLLAVGLLLARRR